MLLLDVGNTRLKWARADGGTIGPVEAQAHGGEPLALLADLPVGADQVWMSSVMGQQLTQQLTDALTQRGAHVHQAAVQAECQGLRVAYREPSRLGVDRWLSMLGLWARQRSAFNIASAGTALTFDAVDDRGQHQGGFIAPGIRAMERATLGSTRFETAVLPAPAAAELGQDTEHCVVQGALHAALGALERAAADHPSPSFIAGGDASLLQPLLHGQWQLAQQPVLDGLLALAQQAD